MVDTVLLMLVVIVFIGLVLHAINQDERRKADRRQQDLPHAVERRRAVRRRNSVISYLGWGLRTQWKRIVR
jgi:cbb3-type cytochrome oxidase subunit 3